MPYIQNADADDYYELVGIKNMAPGAVIWVSQGLYDNSAVIAAALIAGEIIDYEGVGAPQPDAIPHQFETEFQMSIRSGATATSLQLQFLESLGGFEDSDGNLYTAGDTFITFRVELVDNNKNYLLWEGLRGEDPGDGSIALTLTNDDKFQSGQSYPAILGAGVGEYNLTNAVVDNFIITAEVSGGGGGAYQQVVTVAKSGGDFSLPQDAIDSILDAGASKIYTVLVNPGEYVGNVTLKNYVNVIATDVEAVKIVGLVTDNNVECHCSLKFMIEAPGNEGLHVQHANSVIDFEGSILSGPDAAINVINGTVSIVAKNIDGGAILVPAILCSGGILSVKSANITNLAGTWLPVETYGGTVTFEDCIITAISGVPIVISGGTVSIKNSLLRAQFNNADGHGIIKSGGTLTLRNVEITCVHASAKSIYAEVAQTVYGTEIHSTHPKSDNITIIGDVMDIDTPKANTITVAKSGGMFTTIQAAIDSANPIVHSGTAQAGGVNMITLATTASAVNDYYNGMKVRLTGGTGSGQIGGIIDYDGTTKVATVDSNWSVIPDATTTCDVKSIITISVYPGEYNEAITLKDCVNVVAMDPKTTVILQQVTDNNVACRCNLNISMVTSMAIGLYIQNANSIIDFHGNITSVDASCIEIDNGTINLDCDLRSNIRPLNLDGGTVTFKGSVSNSGDYTPAVDIALGTVTIKNATILSNERAIYIGTGVVVVEVIDTSMINTNAPTVRNQGAFGSSVAMRNVRIRNNWADATGHGIYTGKDIVLQDTIIVCTHASAYSITIMVDPVNAYCMGVWANRDDHANVTQMITGGFNYDTNVI